MDTAAMTKSEQDQIYERKSREPVWIVMSPYGVILASFCGPSLAETWCNLYAMKDSTVVRGRATYQIDRDTADDISPGTATR